MAWGLPISAEDFAQKIYDTLDPLYGEDAPLEVITVAVDPDKTIYETYIEPTVEETMKTGKEIYEETTGTYVPKATNLVKYAAAYYLIVLALQR